MVVHGCNTPCACTQYGAYAVRVGVEPSNAALALPVGISPPEGCAHLSLTPATCSSPSSGLIQQGCQPIRFLNARVEFPILLRKIVRLSLGGCHAHRADVLHLGARGTALRSGSRGGQFPVCVVPYFLGRRVRRARPPAFPPRIWI